jgi:hypothetical protein
MLMKATDNTSYRPPCPAARLKNVGALSVKVRPFRQRTDKCSFIKSGQPRPNRMSPRLPRFERFDDRKLNGLSERQHSIDQLPAFAIIKMVQDTVNEHVSKRGQLRPIEREGVAQLKLSARRESPGGRDSLAVGIDADVFESSSEHVPCEYPSAAADFDDHIPPMRLEETQDRVSRSAVSFVSEVLQARVQLRRQMNSRHI